EGWHAVKACETRAGKVAKTVKNTRDTIADQCDQLLSDGDVVTINQNARKRWSVEESESKSYKKVIDAMLPFFTDEQRKMYDTLLASRMEEDERGNMVETNPNLTPVRKLSF